MQAVSFANHGEKAEGLILAIQPEGRIEYLVPTVLGIGLRKHHQLGITGIAAQARKIIKKIIQLRRSESETQAGIGRTQSGTPLLVQGNADQ